MPKAGLVIAAAAGVCVKICNHRNLVFRIIIVGSSGIFSFAGTPTAAVGRGGDKKTRYESNGMWKESEVSTQVRELAIVVQLQGKWSMETAKSNS